MVSLNHLKQFNGIPPSVHYTDSSTDLVPLYASMVGLVAVVEALEKQMRSDAAQGYDYVAYHNYAKRRYYEIVGGKCPSYGIK